MMELFLLTQNKQVYNLFAGETELEILTKIINIGGGLKENNWEKGLDLVNSK